MQFRDLKCPKWDWESLSQTLATTQTVNCNRCLPQEENAAVNPEPDVFYEDEHVDI